MPPPHQERNVVSLRGGLQRLAPVLDPPAATTNKVALVQRRGHSRSASGCSSMLLGERVEAHHTPPPLHVIAMGLGSPYHNGVEVDTPKSPPTPTAIRLQSPW